MGQAGEEQWVDTPPTAVGKYWVRTRVAGKEFVAHFDGEEWLEVGEFGSSHRPRDAAELLQFGRRVPTNAELCELPGLIEELHYFIADDAVDDSDDVLVKIRAILGAR